MKMIEKIEVPDIKQSSRQAPSFVFTPKRPSGKQVLEIDGIDKAFGGKVVLKQIKCKVNRQEKIAIIGHNGIGKSTLLKIAMDLLPPDAGQINWGHETHVSYFAQDHHEMLNQDVSVLQWLSDQFTAVPSLKIRSALSQVLFTQEDVEKNILHLSGGEAARLLMAKIMLENPNVLILDEPTNHLDLESIEALIKALVAYEGTLLLVSHDRYFVSKIVTRVIALTEKGINDFQGNYAAYLKYYQEDYLSRAFLAQT